MATLEQEPIYVIHATWDEEAKVWVATSDDVPGLATEADTAEQLIEKVKVMVPELLKANGISPITDGGILLRLVSERFARAPRRS